MRPFGTLERFHQIRTLTRPTFPFREDQVWPVGYRSRCCGSIRECDVEAESNALGQNNSAFDDVLEFANVAGPVVLLKPCGVCLCQGGRLYSQPLRHVRNGMSREKRDVVTSDTQRRQFEWEHVHGRSIFLSLRPRLFSIAYRMLRSAADAEDIVQDAWVRWQTVVGLERMLASDIAPTAACAVAA
jgi:hypothetical protein